MLLKSGGGARTRLVPGPPGTAPCQWKGHAARPKGAGLASSSLGLDRRDLRRSLRVPSFKGLSLFWRVFLVNAAILVVAGLGVELLVPLPDELDLTDVVDLCVALLAMLIVYSLMRPRLFGPLERLADRMETTDVLRGDERRPIEGVAEIAKLERAFNEMIERLEQERREAGAYALRAQEDERKRLARGLHDEVAQSMTAVLLQLRHLLADASPDERAALVSAQEVVKQSLLDVRRIAQELRPELLDDLGL